MDGWLCHRGLFNIQGIPPFYSLLKVKNESNFDALKFRTRIITLPHFWQACDHLKTFLSTVHPIWDVSKWAWPTLTPPTRKFFSYKWTASMGLPWGMDFDSEKGWWKCTFMNKSQQINQPHHIIPALNLTAIINHRYFFIFNQTARKGLMGSKVSLMPYHPLLRRWKGMYSLNVAPSGLHRSGLQS